MESFTYEDVQREIDKGRCIIIANGYIYDASEYLNKHPGGKYVIEYNKGKNVDMHFSRHPGFAQKKWGEFKIGKLAKNSSGCCIII